MKPITIGLIIGVVVLIVVGLVLVWEEAQKTGLSETEKQQIENWIIENNLNRYGDPKGMMYTGGTPLFDERTGTSIDKYEYILRNHPDRPWLK